MTQEHRIVERGCRHPYVDMRQYALFPAVFIALAATQAAYYGALGAKFSWGGWPNARQRAEVEREKARNDEFNL